MQSESHVVSPVGRVSSRATFMIQIEEHGNDRQKERCRIMTMITLLW